MILRDQREIQTEILDKIPLMKDLLNYWVLQKTILIDQVPYSFNTPEGNQRAEIILQNLIILMGNSVIQLILNNFSDQEEMKEKLFDNHYYSSREIAKFRNIISTQYRQNKLLIEPQEIFESQYKLLHLKNNQIEQIVIYYPRQKELESLNIDYTEYKLIPQYTVYQSSPIYVPQPATNPWWDPNCTGTRIWYNNF